MSENKYLLAPHHSPPQPYHLSKGRDACHTLFQHLTKYAQDANPNLSSDGRKSALAQQERAKGSQAASQETKTCCFFLVYHWQ